MSDQLANFNARISRIKDPKNISYLDPETGMRIPRRLSIGQIKAHNLGSDKPSLPGLIIAVVLGSLALIAARYLRFVYADIPDVGTEAQALILMDFGLAAVVMFFVGGMIGQKTFRHMMAHAAGIAVMIVAMHNLVWIYPTEFAQVFSNEYVGQVKALTQPQSIYLAGETITL